MKPVNLTGQRFGRLTVEKDSGKRSKNRQTIWECKCDCGNIKYVRIDRLKSGDTQSCGCLSKEKSAKRAEHFKKDLSDKRFGRLLVIKDTGKRQAKHIIWECKCDCGNIVEVSSTHLIEGVTQSCGCLSLEISLPNIKESFEKALVEDTNLFKLTSTIPKNNTSGAKGVYWHNGMGKWKAEIGFQKKTIHLGYFMDLNEAIKARKLAEEKYFKPILEKYNRATSIL